MRIPANRVDRTGIRRVGPGCAVCGLMIAAALAGGVAADTVGSPEPTSGPAAAPLPEGACLADYVGYALENHPDLAAARHRWRAAVERVPQARALPDPQAAFSVVLDQVERSPEYMGERYAISQAFPWIGKRALGGGVAQAGADAEALRLEAARLDVIRRVSLAYFEYAYQHEAVRIARENLALLGRLESVARAMFRAGAASLSDVSRAQVEIGRLDDQVRSLADRLGVAAARLNAALGRSAHARLPAAAPRSPSSEVVAELPGHTDDQWLDLAREQNPELAAARRDAEGDRRAALLAHKSFFPDISVGVEYARGAGARMARMDGGGSDMLAGMVAMNLPVWRRAYDAGVRETEARVGEAGSRLRSLGNRLETDLKTALYNHRDSLRKLALYRDTLLPMARQTLATTETAYRAGQASFSDLIDAQRVLLEFSLAHERAAADRAQSFAEIQAMVGRAIHGDASGNSRTDEPARPPSSGPDPR